MGGASSKNRSDTSPIETLDKAPVFIQDHDESLENGTFETHNGAPHSISLNKDIIQQRNFLENSPVNSRENVAPSATQIVSQTDRSTPAAQIFSQTDRSTPAAQIFSQTDRSTPAAQIFSKTDRSTPAAQISSQTDRSPLKFDKSNIAQFDKSQNFYSRDKSGRLNPETANPAAEPSRLSGVYNRHVTSSNVPPNIGTNNNGINNFQNASSLLRKDKFSLMGSQLQKQESQIFSRSLQQGKDISPSPRLSFATSNLLLTSCASQSGARFDSNKFRRVNEPGATCAVQNGALKNSRHGPLDERDEELIASIEQEFRFT